MRWADRSSLRRSDGPWLGLYLWARFEAGPSPSIPYPELPEEVVYVGETKNLDQRPLAGRHHRLAHWRDSFPDDPQFTQLYLSICRLQQFQGGYAADAAKTLYPRLRVYTQYVEAKLYWEYTQHWGHLPALHYKKGSRDRDVS